MCEYVLSCNEIIDSFEKWLQEQEGTVRAEELAEAWNKLAKKNKWDDRLHSMFI